MSRVGSGGLNRDDGWKVTTDETGEVVIADAVQVWRRRRPATLFATCVLMCGVDIPQEMRRAVEDIQIVERKFFGRVLNSNALRLAAAFPARLEEPHPGDLRYDVRVWWKGQKVEFWLPGMVGALVSQTSKSVRSFGKDLPAVVTFNLIVGGVPVNGAAHVRVAFRRRQFGQPSVPYRTDAKLRRSIMFDHRKFREVTLRSSVAGTITKRLRNGQLSTEGSCPVQMLSDCVKYGQMNFSIGVAVKHSDFDSLFGLVIQVS
jgi:hypothetical protein